MAKQKNSAFMRPVFLSTNLEAVVGKGPMPRTEVTKKLWDYIKKNDLQDSKDRRKIVPDTALGKVIGSKSIDMFKMTSKVSEHLSDKAMA